MMFLASVTADMEHESGQHLYLKTWAVDAKTATHCCFIIAAMAAKGKWKMTYKAVER